MAQSQQKRKHLGIADWIVLILVVTGIGVLSYPFVSDAYVSYKNQQVISAYQKRETKQNAKALNREFAEYQQKNAELAASKSAPGLSIFNSAVNADGTAKTDAKRNQKRLTNDTIAQVTIPKIGVDLPVFSHTTDWLLQFGSCLLDGTSYPTGGRSTHAVISAHRGVPNAMLFTRLPELKKGDKFFIEIGGRKHAYRVIRKKVIRPEDMSQLKVVDGQDLVTLMTCTPYMINSHRLLVTGERVPYTAEDAKAASKAEWWNKLKLALWGLVGLLFAGIIVLIARGMLIRRNDYLLVAPTDAMEAVVSLGRRKRALARNEDGQFETTLPGGKYWLRVKSISGATRRYRVFVKKRRDERFTLKLHR